MSQQQPSAASQTGAAKPVSRFSIPDLADVPQDIREKILLVQEIRGYEPATRIAGAPEYVHGVLNLRGVIVPIVDLRLKLGLAAEFDPFTVTVVSGSTPTTATITYVPLPTTLDLAIAGVPGGVDAPVTVSAPPRNRMLSVMSPC